MLKNIFAISDAATNYRKMFWFEGRLTSLSATLLVTANSLEVLTTGTPP